MFRLPQASSIKTIFLNDKKITIIHFKWKFANVADARAWESHKYV